jgi:hypothetical protein
MCTTLLSDQNSSVTQRLLEYVSKNQFSVCIYQYDRGRKALMIMHKRRMNKTAVAVMVDDRTVKDDFPGVETTTTATANLFFLNRQANPYSVVCSYVNAQVSIAIARATRLCRL